MNCKPEITSPYYPYFKVKGGDFTFDRYALFPKKICDYLIDAPSGAYTPIDDNKYPRCRIWKYLYYDGARPLENPLPTIAEKMSVLFDPRRADHPPTDKNYRLVPLEYIKQSQEEAMTRIYVYMGRSIASENDNTFATSVVFDVFTHYSYETNMQTDEYSRSGAIVSALIEALNGVNIDGIGTFSMSKRLHPDSGTHSIFDGNTNVGHELVIGLEMASTAPNDVSENENMPPVGGIKII